VTPLAQRDIARPAAASRILPAVLQSSPPRFAVRRPNRRFAHFSEIAQAVGDRTQLDHRIADGARLCRIAGGRVGSV
jgi:hypothetical protein